jgi:glycoprotein 2-beta-D-xylosyltransferase
MHQATHFDGQATPSSSASNCERVIKRPALFVTRYEYANIYHTLDDWYNVYQTMQQYGITAADAPYIVLFDGHSRGSLDATWRRLFGPDAVHYVSHFAEQRLCFENAYIVPAGYQSALGVVAMVKPTDYCTSSPQLRDFRNYFLRMHGLPFRTPSPPLVVTATATAAAAADTVATLSRPIKVTIIFRGAYMAHPRLKLPLVATRKFKREAEIIEFARSVGDNIVVRGVHFENMTMLEQMQVIASTDVLCGMHGAGLSYALFLPRTSHVLELTSPRFKGRPHFRFFSQWSGLSYSHLMLPKASKRDPDYDVPQDAFVKALGTAIEQVRKNIVKLSASRRVAAATAAPLFDDEAAGGPYDAALQGIVDRYSGGGGAGGAGGEGSSGGGGSADNGADVGDFHKSSEDTVLRYVRGEIAMPAVPVPALNASTPPRHRLAVIIPFRDSASKTSQGGNRTANLVQTVPYLIAFLEKTGKLRVRDFEIIIVEQTQGHVFNKGALFNAGYMIARHAFDYMVLHDVDQLPLEAANTYDYNAAEPIHLCSASSQFGFKMAYGSMVGGALLLTMQHY